MNEAELAACVTTMVRYRAMFESFTRPATELILARLMGAPLLDVASGIGDPALAIAAVVAPLGAVTATDLLPPLLAELAREAAQRGLDNVHTSQADMHALPHASATFECVVSRLGLQQARDPGLALREAQRVLCTGGRAIYVVWGGPEQPLLRHTVLEPLARLGGPCFRVGEPGPLRFAAAGALASVARAQGLCVIEAQECEAAWCWPGSARSLWRATCETSAPLFEPLLARLSEAERAELEDQVLAGLGPYEREGRTVLPVRTQLLLAQKV